MIAYYRKRAYWGILWIPIIMAASLATLNTILILKDPENSVTRPLLLVGELGILASYIWGCYNEAKGKGYPGWLGLLGILTLIGFIILIVLPDKKKNG